MTSHLHAALAAAHRAWPVFPLQPNRKQPRAGWTNWEQRATVDPERITRWWCRHASDNVAIATGPAGLVVVDLDIAKPDEQPPPEWAGAKGGADVLEVLAAQHRRPVGPTFTVVTASGGRHLYFRTSKSGRPCRNTAGRIGWRIDTRAEGGYVVAAGSTVDGRPYEVIDDTVPVELPAWIADVMRAVPQATTTAAVDVANRPVERRQGYIDVALRGETERVLGAPVGQRNAALNRAAWNLARLVAVGLVQRSVVEQTLTEAGCAAGGQSPAGVAATIRSAIDARLARGAAS